MVVGNTSKSMQRTESNTVLVINKKQFGCALKTLSNIGFISKQLTLPGRFSINILSSLSKYFLYQLLNNFVTIYPSFLFITPLTLTYSCSFPSMYICYTLFLSSTIISCLKMQFENFVTMKADYSLIITYATTADFSNSQKYSSMG